MNLGSCLVELASACAHSWQHQRLILVSAVDSVLAAPYLMTVHHMLRSCDVLQIQLYEHLNLAEFLCRSLVLQLTPADNIIIAWNDYTSMIQININIVFKHGGRIVKRT